MNLIIVAEDDGQLRAFHAAVLSPAEREAVRAIADRHIKRVRALSRISEAVEVQQVNGRTIREIVHDADTGRTRVSFEDKGGVSRADASLLTQGELARTAGYSGSVCASCGSFEMVRSGTCETCKSCGATSGCG